MALTEQRGLILYGFLGVAVLPPTLFERLFLRSIARCPFWPPGVGSGSPKSPSGCFWTASGWPDRRPWQLAGARWPRRSPPFPPWDGPLPSQNRLFLVMPLNGMLLPTGTSILRDPSLWGDL